MLDSYVTPALQADLFAQALGGVQTVIAPPCRQQGDYTTRAGTTQYPHISAAPDGHTAEP